MLHEAIPTEIAENEAELIALCRRLHEIPEVGDALPATRRLVAVTPTGEKETEEMFELLLGDNLAGRKEYIAEYGKLYLKDADI